LAFSGSNTIQLDVSCRTKVNIISATNAALQTAAALPGAGQVDGTRIITSKAL